MSPRRSSRARTTQPTPTLQQHTNSSTSSVSSSRADRNARSNQKQPSPRSSVAAQSQSSEDHDGSARPQARRTRSSQEDVKDELPPAIDDENEEEGEEEVTRCICGNQEYPGLPVTGNEPTKEKPTIDSDPVSLSEDSTGWFIQCDDCKVWQHGGCVGIMDEATSPEEYFCEQCRKDLHKVFSSANGRKYSHYIPVQDSKSPHSSPEPKAHDNSKRTRDSRASRGDIESLPKGRRATMNSRDSAYDETEQLRRAIEESKKDSGPATSGSGTRKGKRSRSESEERQEDTKRLRTTSGSTSSQSKSGRQDAETEDESGKVDKYKSVRGTAARNQRSKDAQVRDREPPKEKDRPEPVGRRKGRAEKKLSDESEPSPDPPSRTASSKGPYLQPPAAAPPPSTPQLPIPKPSHHKKTGRPPTRRGRIVRNQYTKALDSLNPSHTRTSPAGSHLSDNESPHVNGNHNSNHHRGDSNGGGGVGKPSRPRHMNPNRTTMNDMKRRVAGILEFISHTQVEMAGIEVAFSGSRGSNSASTTPNGSGNGHGHGNGTAKGGSGAPGVVAIDVSKADSALLRDVDAVDDDGFGSLSSVEMMEVLTRRLMRWQGEYGKWGEK